MTFATHLTCSACGTDHDHRQLQGLCTKCSMPLVARYDLEALKDRGPRFVGRSLWRYRDLLPVDDDEARVTLGEGTTPLLAAPRLAEELGLRTLFIKDEGTNPTGTFKARGMALAVTRARHLGASALAVPSAGNAAGALAAYGARAGLPVHVAMPQDVPAANRAECERFGAEITLVDGLIGDCGKLVSQRAATSDWFDVATFKEPYRLEGKKTMGLELYEDLGGAVPDVVVYPTGGGTGLVGIVKAFDELEGLGVVGSERPRMVAVQATGCAPIVDAVERGLDAPRPWPDATTAAAGLRVPGPLSGPLIVDAIRRTGGTAVAVDDDAMATAQGRLAGREAVWACLEGAATLAGLDGLVHDGQVDRDEVVVLLNTGAGWKG